MSRNYKKIETDIAAKEKKINAEITENKKVVAIITLIIIATIIISIGIISFLYFTN